MSHAIHNTLFKQTFAAILTSAVPINLDQLGWVTYHIKLNGWMLYHRAPTSICELLKIVSPALVIEFMLCICFLPAVYYYVLLCICTCICRLLCIHVHIDISSGWLPCQRHNFVLMEVSLAHYIETECMWKLWLYDMWLNKKILSLSLSLRKMF